MYSLDINFLNDRTQRPVEGATSTRRRGVANDNPRPLYYGIAIGAFLPALAGVLWFFAQSQNTELLAEQQQLDGQLQTLQAQLQQVEGVRAQVNQINQENQALATVFDRIKPWSAILQDVRNRVPAGVQITTITQSPPEAAPTAPAPAPAASPDPNQPVPETPPPVSRIEIDGVARNFTDVNDLVLVLQQSPFLTGADTRLVSAELVDNPIQVEFVQGQTGQSQPQVEVQLPDVVRFKVATTLTNQPASELLQDLRDTLAVGLPARIDALRDLGVKP